MGSSFKLTYFDARGRGEQFRILFAEADVDYEDFKMSLTPAYPGRQFLNMKKEGKFQWNVVPLLEETTESGRKIEVSQTAAIMQYLSKKFDLWPSEKTVSSNDVRSVLELEANALMIWNVAEDIRILKYNTQGAKDQAKVSEFLVKFPSHLKLCEQWLEKRKKFEETGNKGGQEDGEGLFMVYNKITGADISLWDVFDQIGGQIQSPSLPPDFFEQCWSICPLLKQWRDQVKSRPRISEYLDKRFYHHPY